MSVKGSCHCGAVAWTLDATPTKAIECNCSRCKRLGLLLDFYPPSAFKLEKGKEKLTSYKFNKHVIDHLFCLTCGVQSFARGKNPKGEEMVAVNLRCVEGIDLGKLKITPFDGASH